MAAPKKASGGTHEARWGGPAGHERVADERLADRAQGREVKLPGRQDPIGAAQQGRFVGRLRGERRALDALLDAPYDEEHPLAPGLAAFERRSAALVPIVAELRARQEAGRLSLSILDLAPSYIHMFSNRIIRSDGRAHEVVLYDFLHRLTLSRVARARKAKKATG